MNEKADSDSIKSRIGDEETRIGDTGKKPKANEAALSDPDAGLSDEERAQIVRHGQCFSYS